MNTTLDDRPTSDPTSDPTSETLRAEIDRLAVSIDRFGFDGAEHDALEHLLAVASDRGASPVVAGVLADSGAPPAVRERAFGLVARQTLWGADRHHRPLAA